MPTATFYHLATEKQMAVLIAAEAEFSQYSFYDASINRIIKSAGIPRGSFYMYFENKEDLFLYLLMKARDELFSELEPMLLQYRDDVFGFYLQLYDILVKQIFASRYKDFLLGVFINMNATIIRHLMDFAIDHPDFDKTSPFIAAQQYFSQLQQLPAATSLAIIEMLRDSLVNGIIALCLEEKTIEQARHSLQLKAQLLTKLL